LDCGWRIKVVRYADAKRLHAADQGIKPDGQQHGVRLRQSYLRIAKRAAMMAGRYVLTKAS
jgi:IS5 family transposase